MQQNELEETVRHLNELKRKFKGLREHYSAEAHVDELIAKMSGSPLKSGAVVEGVIWEKSSFREKVWYIIKQIFLALTSAASLGAGGLEILDLIKKCNPIIWSIGIQTASLIISVVSLVLIVKNVWDLKKKLEPYRKLSHLYHEHIVTYVDGIKCVIDLMLKELDGQGDSVKMKSFSETSKNFLELNEKLSKLLTQIVYNLEEFSKCLKNAQNEAGWKSTLFLSGLFMVIGSICSLIAIICCPPAGAVLAVSITGFCTTALGGFISIYGGFNAYNTWNVLRQVTNDAMQLKTAISEKRGELESNELQKYTIATYRDLLLGLRRMLIENKYYKEQK